MKLLALHLDKFVDYARLRGMPYETIVSAVPSFALDRKDPATVMDKQDFYSILEGIAAYLNDELLGIRVGNHLNLNTLGAVYRISLKSVTVQEVLHYCQAYLVETLPMVQVVNSIEGNSASVVLSIAAHQHRLDRLILETTLMVMARELKIVSGPDTLISLSSPHYHPGYPPGWRKGDQFKLDFEQIVLKAALKDNSHWGLDILIPEYLALVEALKAADTLGSRVKKAMLQLAQPALPDLDMVADAFNLTSRTLQRRLVQEGTSFRQIAEGLKRQVCQLLMLHDRYSVADISLLLGYSDAAAFIHSFRKWHGATPAKLREQIPRPPNGTAAG